MFATKTIYATEDWTIVKNIIASTLSGFALSFAFVAYYIRYIYGSTSTEDLNTSESDEHEEELEEDVAKRAAKRAFQNGYYDELEALADEEVSVERRKELSTIILQEVTPDGEIVLSYDDNAEGFRYYSNSFLKVSYQTLDALARKFAVLNNCKALCINGRQELILAQEKIDKKDVMANPEPEPRSIFAKFKKYDKVRTNIKNVTPVPERSNRFLYRGNLLAAKLAADKLAADKLAADNLAADTLTANNLTANNLTANNLTANNLTATNLTANNLTADTLTANNLTANNLTNTTAILRSNQMDYATFKRLILNNH